MTFDKIRTFATNNLKKVVIPIDLKDLFDIQWTLEVGVSKTPQEIQYIVEITKRF